MKNNSRSLVSFSADLKRRMKDKKFKERFELEKFRIEVALMLIQMRKKNKLTQKSLADKLGTSQSAVARIESGKDNFTVDTLGKIAATFRKNVKISFV